MRKRKKKGRPNEYNKRTGTSIAANKIYSWAVNEHIAYMIPATMGVIGFAALAMVSHVAVKRVAEKEHDGTDGNL